MKSNDKTDDGGEHRPRSNGQIPVVGIGASAGGIGALESLLPLLKTDSGLAYVIVQHLDPHHESSLIEVLGRRTRMPVVAATDQIAIEQDRVYVIPRNTTLTVSDGHLHLWP